MLAVAKNLLIFRSYLVLTERIFRLPEFDSETKKCFDNNVLYRTNLDGNWQNHWALLSASCGFNSRREHQFEAVMIEKVIAAFFVSWVEISTRNWKNGRISSTQNKILPPIWKLLFSTRMWGIWCREEKGVSMDANLVFLSVRFRPEKDRCSD